MKNYIAINTDTESCEAIGSADFVVSEVLRKFDRTHIKNQIKFFELGQEVGMAVDLKPLASAGIDY
jgi:hypothetical protein